MSEATEPRPGVGPTMSVADLIGLAACAHRTSLDREVALGLRSPPLVEAPLSEMLAGLGKEHEAAQLERLLAGRSSAVTIDRPPHGCEGLASAEEATVEAMRSGTELIHRATFCDAPLHGQADFLLRVDEPSDLGPWSYEVAETKLHRRPRSSDWLEVGFHSRQVARLQGRMPVMGHVVLGDGTWVSEPVAGRVEQVAALEGQLLRFLSDPPATEPEPCPACSRCRWAPQCRTAWRDRGHLILLKLDDRTRGRFVASGMTTVEEVAALPVGAEVEGVAPETVRLARSDAKLLLHQRASGSPYLRLRYPREGKGLFLLPPPVPGDVFLDLEGHPHGRDGQREYLFGLAVEHRGGLAYRARWAHGAAEEEAGFGEVVEFLADWIAADPARRVYHYHSYEPAAFRRLAAARSGGWVAAAAIELLETAFVDLLPIVRDSEDVRTL